jgi:hypothetical protein
MACARKLGLFHQPRLAPRASPRTLECFICCVKATEVRDEKNLSFLGLGSLACMSAQGPETDRRKDEAGSEPQPKSVSVLGPS